MKMVKCSRLNPLASSFVPSNVVGAVATESSVISAERGMVAQLPISIKSVASYYVQKIIEVKRERGEYAVTKPEMVNLIQKLICLQYNISNQSDMLNIRAYLSDKIPNSVLLNLSQSSSSRKTDRNYDLLTFRPPPQTFLLVAFCGLYRHEQACRPMLSLPPRPEALQDKVWSLTEKDLKLWNQSFVQSCDCPPMFGYTIPSRFFGNPLNLRSFCQLNEIHMPCSEESENGNEYILQDNVGSYPFAEQGFVDFEETAIAKRELEYYSEQLKAIVASVFSMIDELEEYQAEDLMDEGYESCENFSESLWNADFSEPNMLNDKIEEDYDHHPLLDIETSGIEDEEVPMEVKEMLRRSLSSTTEVTPNNCNPPCSVWCAKLERSESLPNRANSSTTGLLSETTDLITGISSGAGPLLPLKHSRPSFRRSFSTNDSDSLYDYKAKTDPSFFKRPSSCRMVKVRSDSWKDSDSGIITQWSSQEDVFSEDESGRAAPMWTLFNGENSLWKPLPESEQSRSISHKRVRDMKRQTSSVN